MKRPLVMAALLCAGSLAHATERAEENLVVISVRQAECNAKPVVEWPLKGMVDLGQVLRQLATIGCERYIVPEGLLHTKVSLKLRDQQVPVYEMQHHVVEALRAAGISVALETAYRVTQGAPREVAALPPISTAPRRPPPVEPAVSAEELDQGIRCTGNSCELSRALVEKIFSDGAGLTSAARLVTSIEAGVPNGVKVYAVRPRSYFERLGLQNGDTISSVNGDPIDTPNKALEIYIKVRNATHVTLRGIRRGQPLVLEYTIK